MKNMVKNKEEEDKTQFNCSPNEWSTVFNATVDGKLTEILKLCGNGDIFVKGKLSENDKEVVNALREFLKSQGFL